MGQALLQHMADVVFYQLLIKFMIRLEPLLSTAHLSSLHNFWNTVSSEIEFMNFCRSGKPEPSRRYRKIRRTRHKPFSRESTWRTSTSTETWQIHSTATRCLAS